MAETRKLAAILAADVAGYSKLAGADEERTLARLRALRSDLIDPDHRRASRARRRAHRRWQPSSSSAVWSTPRAAPLRCRTAWPTAMLASRPSSRIEFRVGVHRRRRGRGERRRPDGRRRRHRRAPGRHRQARRHLSVRASLLAGQVAARSRRQRSGRDPTQEHRRPGPGLCNRSRQVCAGEADQARRTKAVANVRAAVSTAVFMLS